MNLSEIPYEGTHEELQEVEREITRNQRHRAQLDAEYTVLQEHRSLIRHIIDRRVRT